MVKFYTDHIKFHILIVICEFCFILFYRKRCDIENCDMMCFLVEILCPVLFVHQNLKKHKNFFSALVPRMRKKTITDEQKICHNMLLFLYCKMPWSIALRAYL